MTDNEVKKPLVMLQNEFMCNMVQLINSSGLPAFILEPLINNVYNEIKMSAQQEYLNSKQSYDEQHTDSHKHNNNEKDS